MRTRRRKDPRKSCFASAPDLHVALLPGRPLQSEEQQKPGLFCSAAASTSECWDSPLRRGKGRSRGRPVARALTFEVAACVEHIGGQRDLEGALHLPRQRIIDVPLLQANTHSQPARSPGEWEAWLQLFCIVWKGPSTSPGRASLMSHCCSSAEHAQQPLSASQT